MIIRSRKINALVYHILVIAFGFFMIYPLLWMVSASFKNELEIFQGINFLPKVPTIANYINGWKGVSGYSFARFLLNSFFIVIVNIIATIISSSMAAYAFSKLKFKLNRVLFSVMMVTMMLPFHVRLIPQYIIFNKLGWINTFLPLTIPAFFAVDGFNIFLMVQFMRTLSNELLEAPRLDGCNTFDIYLRFVLPLSTPVLVTVAIFTFIWEWNDFMSQMIYLSNPALFTVSLALRMFVDATGQSAWGSLFAMSCLSLIPMFIVFIVFQRYLIEGITSGSLKG
ncbi:MAG: carbohydrate ABC transporter permease [Treponema sp.]|nr:carbohydrate ABC transporter permease [Treponema sp.]